MTPSTRRQPAPPPKTPMAWQLLWGWPLFGLLLEAQLHALIVWQESMAVAGKDAWDRCVVRYCGGVPIDG